MQRDLVNGEIQTQGRTGIDQPIHLALNSRRPAQGGRYKSSREQMTGKNNKIFKSNSVQVQKKTVYLTHART